VARYGARWAVVLAVPAMLGELLWSAELLVAIGAACGVLLGVDLATAILVSAAVVTCYTVVGGMWSVGYTDTVQFALIPIGLPMLLLALSQSAVRLRLSGHRETQRGRRVVSAARPKGSDHAADRRLVGPFVCSLGGIPGTATSTRSPARRWQSGRQSLLAGVLTIAMTVPPLKLDRLRSLRWTPEAAERPRDRPRWRCHCCSPRPCRRG
jgi:hypothetical protein